MVANPSPTDVTWYFLSVMFKLTVVMNPEQPQPNLSIDYLNQIAPEGPKRKIALTKIQLIIVGVVLAAIVVVLILVIVIGATSNKKPLQQLAARLQSTETIVGKAQAEIKSTQLRALNSNLKIYFTNTNRDIAAPLLKEKVDPTKLDADIVSSETGADVSSRLENARLNAVFDRTYAREMAYRLDTIVALMRQLQNSVGTKDLKTFLVSALTNLEPTQKSFADFNAANG